MAGDVPRGEGLPAGYSLRPYRDDDADALIGVGVRSTGLLARHGYPDLLAEPPAGVRAFRAFARRCSILVVETAHEVAGYAATAPVGDFLHLKELAVDPAHGRRGLGSAMLAAVVAQAARDGHSGVTLSTFRDVPFNAPFYAARGFLELPRRAAPEGLRRVFADEVPPGINPRTRVLMLHRV